MVKRRTPLNETLVVDVDWPLSGQEKVYHYEPRRAQILVCMESENGGISKQSSSSRLDDIVHQRFFYDSLLQLKDS